MTTNPTVTRLPSVLSFEGIEINVIYYECRPWIPGTDVARALGYATTDHIAKLYSRGRNHFTEDMTLSSGLIPWEGVAPRTRRLFSPRGCYILAKLSKTDRAEAFRKWVVDVLEKAQGEASSEEEMSLTAAVQFHSERVRITASALRGRIRERFNVRNIHDLSLTDKANAIIWLASLTVESFRGKYRKPLDAPQGFVDAEAAREHARERMSFDEAVRAVNMPGRRLSFEPMAEPAGPLVTLTFAVPASAAAEVCALVARLSAPISATTGQGE